MDDKKMDNKRKGEIGLLLLKEHVRKNKNTVSPETGRQYESLAKKIGVDPKELKQFIREELNPILIEQIEESVK